MPEQRQIFKKYFKNIAQIIANDRNFQDLWKPLEVTAGLNDFEKFDKSVSATPGTEVRRAVLEFRPGLTQVEYFFYLKPGPGFNPDLENFRALFINGTLQRYGRWGSSNDVEKPKFNCFIDNKNPSNPIEYSGFITEEGDCEQVLRKSKNIEFLGKLKKFKAEGKCIEYDRTNDQFLTIEYENGVPRGQITVDSPAVRYSYLVGKFGEIRSKMDTSVCSGTYQDDKIVEFGIQTDFKAGSTSKGVFQQAEIRDGEIEFQDRIVRGFFERVVDANLARVQHSIQNGEIRYKSGKSYKGRILDYEPSSLDKFSHQSDHLRDSSRLQMYQAISGSVSLAQPMPQIPSVQELLGFGFWGLGSNYYESIMKNVLMGKLGRTLYQQKMTRGFSSYASKWISKLLK